MLTLMNAVSLADPAVAGQHDATVHGSRGEGCSGGHSCTCVAAPAHKNSGLASEGAWEQLLEFVLIVVFVLLAGLMTVHGLSSIVSNEFNTIGNSL